MLNLRSVRGTHAPLTLHLWGLGQTKEQRKGIQALSLGRQMGRWEHPRGRTARHWWPIKPNTCIDQVVEESEMSLQSPKYDSGTQGWDLGAMKSENQKLKITPQSAFGSSQVAQAFLHPNLDTEPLKLLEVGALPATRLHAYMPVPELREVLGNCLLNWTV